MTGYNYKRKPAEGESEHVIMRDGDASSSATSESDHGGDCRKKHKSISEHGTDFFQSTRFSSAVVTLVLLCSFVVIVQVLIDLRIVEIRSKNRMPSYVMFCITLGICGLFVLEMVAKVLCMRLAFFKQRMECVDAVVVALTFSLMLAFSTAHEGSVVHGIGLVLLLRLWRVSKIVNSVVESVKQDAERRLAKEQRRRKALEREVCKLRDYCLQQEFELDTLRFVLQQHSIPPPMALRVPVVPRTICVVAEVNAAACEPQQRPPSDLC